MSTNVIIEKGAVVQDSILLPGARVMSNAKVYRSIMGEHSVVETKTTLGSKAKNADITLIGDNEVFKG